MNTDMHDLAAWSLKHAKSAGADNCRVSIYSDRKVVDGVSLNLPSRRVIGLLGPNGAGKTTTFYMTVGMVPIIRRKPAMSSSSSTTCVKEIDEPASTDPTPYTISAPSNNNGTAVTAFSKPTCASTSFASAERPPHMEGIP